MVRTLDAPIGCHRCKAAISWGNGVHFVLLCGCCRWNDRERERFLALEPTKNHFGVCTVFAYLMMAAVCWWRSIWNALGSSWRQHFYKLQYRRNIHFRWAELSWWRLMFIAVRMVNEMIVCDCAVFMSHSEFSAARKIDETTINTYITLANHNI